MQSAKNGKNKTTFSAYLKCIKTEKSMLKIHTACLCKTKEDYEPTFNVYFRNTEKIIHTTCSCISCADTNLLLMFGCAI